MKKSKELKEFLKADNKELFRQEVVAEYIGMSTHTLERNRWLNIGIPYIKKANRVFYKKGQVVKWLEEKEKNQAE